MNTRKFASKIFRNGHILLALTLAVRGIPRTWQPDEKPVKKEVGWAIYAEEIELLDTIKPEPRLFQSGVLGAALITTALNPMIISFWRQVNEERWSRCCDDRIDAAGWLLHQILRHTDNPEIARRPDYQHWLFQAGLSAAMAWQRSQDSKRTEWLKENPPAVAIPQLLEAVRQRKKCRRAPEGFRHASRLTRRIPALAPTLIEHKVDYGLACEMARRVCQLTPFSCPVRDIETARQCLVAQSIPPEMAAPGALAAFLICVAQDSDRIRIWNDVFSGRWSHHADEGSDVAGLIVRSLWFHNRVAESPESQAKLFARIFMAIKSHERKSRTLPCPRAKNLPHARRPWCADILAAWKDLPVPQGPEIHAGQLAPVQKGGADQNLRPHCQKRRGRGRDRTGRRGEKIFERFHELCALPSAGRLIDRSREQCGYDYELERDGEPSWLFEVKVVQEGRAIGLTEKQVEVASRLRRRYWLVLVEEQTDGQHKISLIRDPSAVLELRKESRIVVQTSYRAAYRAWNRAKKLAMKWKGQVTAGSADHALSESAKKRE